MGSACFVAFADSHRVAGRLLQPRGRPAAAELSRLGFGAECHEHVPHVGSRRNGKATISLAPKTGHSICSQKEWQRICQDARGQVILCFCQWDTPTDRSPLPKEGVVPCGSSRCSSWLPVFWQLPDGRPRRSRRRTAKRSDRTAPRATSAALGTAKPRARKKRGYVSPQMFLHRPAVKNDPEPLPPPLRPPTMADEAGPGNGDSGREPRPLVGEGGWGGRPPPHNSRKTNSCAI